MDTKMIKTICAVGAFSLAATLAWGGVPVTVTAINYSDKPVYATAVTLPAESIYQAYGLAAGTPVQLVRDSGEPVPVLSGIEDGVPVLRAFLSLNAGETASLTVKPAAEWDRPEAVCSAVLDINAGTATVQNGVVELTYRAGRWSLAYVGSPAAAASANSRVLIENCHLDVWLDTVQRGRLLGLDPKPLGLVHADTAKLAGGEANVNPDGSVTLTLVKTFDGNYSDVILTETFTLSAGKPVVLYRPVFENRGDESRYVAYVNLGGGVRGNYGNLLRAAPMLMYDDPREPKRVLLSGPANEYTRVAWRPERCWVGVDSGLGCGIGVSSLEEVNRPLIGSTVWAFLGGEFLACFVQEKRSDPEDNSNFPYEIKGGASLSDIGLAFMATCGDADIWHQTKVLFKAVTAGKPLPISNPYAVYLNGQPLVPAEVSLFDAPDRMASDGEAQRVALTVDFKNPYLLNAKATGQPLTLTVSPLAGYGTPVELASLGPNEEVTVDFTALTGWLGTRKSFVLQASAPLAKLKLAQAPHTGPELSSPSDNLSLTDLAVFFRWKGIKGVIDYELQMARDPDFADPVTLAVRSEIEWPVFLPADNQLPAPGIWYWRVRAVEGTTRGSWSVSRKMTVNNDHGKKPLRFSITPQNPLFTFEGFTIRDWSKFKDTFPEDIRPYMAFNTDMKFDLIEHLRPLHENNQRVFIRTHHPQPMTVWTPLADVEEAFQKYPNVMGVMGGEALSASYSGGERQVYLNRLLKLCGKYGRLFYEADGTYPAENKWEALYAKNGDLMREYRDYLIFAQKNNILHRQFVSQSAVLGLYLSGEIGNQGAWEDGGWYWQQVGFKKLGEILGQRGGLVQDMPRIFYPLTFLMGVSRGCAVYSLEGQTGVARVGAGYSIGDRGFPPTGNPSAYYTSEGELTPSFHRFIAPFIRGVIRHDMVPSKEQLREQIRLGVYNDGAELNKEHDPYYYEWEALYRGTYGFRDIGVYPGTLMEFFPNSGRYHYIPVFPQGRTELKGIQTLPLSQVQDASEVRSVFDAAYPQWYEGNALVQLAGDTLTVMNSNENTDEKQTYAVPLKNRGIFLNVGGTIEPHSYVMGKFEEGNKRLWLQANTEYAERPTELRIRCRKKPDVKIIPETAALVNEWDARTKTLRLTLDHTDGAVELELH